MSGPVRLFAEPLGDRPYILHVNVIDDEGYAGVEFSWLAIPLVAALLAACMHWRQRRYRARAAGAASEVEST